MKRRYLRAKESRRVRDELVSKLTVASEFVSAKEPIELAEGFGYEVFFISGKPTFARSKARLFPTLTNEEFIGHFPTVVVDMGAVAFVCNGADVMAPGIVRYDGTFRKGEVVVVVDERHGRPLAVCFTLYDAGEAKKIKQGKVLENIHYVGDRLWTLLTGQNAS
ncbi:MAG: DUF1947 domain-containing protein [Candidatus Bathyarchaeota archaeon]|nr:MAG: DUF1947 domain-containing protein [Candidatus Bathyarchaeota archaeon]